MVCDPSTPSNMYDSHDVWSNAHVTIMHVWSRLYDKLYDMWSNDHVMFLTYTWSHPMCFQIDASMCNNILLKFSIHMMQWFAFHELYWPWNLHLALIGHLSPCIVLIIITSYHITSDTTKIFQQERSSYKQP
jgi:hypothetical protein